MKKFFFSGFALALPFFGFAQHEGHTMMDGAPEASEEKVEKFNFVCPMHPEVISDNSGTCYKCGMNLEKRISASKNSSDKAYFFCPDHTSVKKDKKDRCADCGKKLKKRKIYTYD